MNNNLLRESISKVSERIPAEDIPLIMSCAQSAVVKKGQVLLREGEICRSFYLVESGYLRAYHYKDGVAINLNFTFEGDFTTNPKSISKREPSEMTIEAGEKTTVWIFNLDVIVNEFKWPPQVALFIRRLAVHILLEAEEQNSLFKMFTPTERYHYIEKNNPKLLQRVSLSQISSYLGVARETLSRIRKKKQ